MNTRSFYGKKKGVSSRFLRPPPSDSTDSELASSSDDNECVTVLQRIFSSSSSEEEPEAVADASLAVATTKRTIKRKVQGQQNTPVSSSAVVEPTSVADASLPTVIPKRTIKRKVQGQQNTHISSSAVVEPTTVADASLPTVIPKRTIKRKVQGQQNTPISSSAVVEPTGVADATATTANVHNCKQRKKQEGNKWVEDHLDNSVKQLPFTGNDSLPEEILLLKTPLQFFHQIFSLQLEELIVEQSNLFATQERPEKPLKLTLSELQQFIGCVIWMSLIKLPSIRRYWRARFDVKVVSETMTQKRWEEIKRFLHFSDNSFVSVDKLRKVRPVLDGIRESLLKVPKEESLCVDEQIIPFKGKSSLKQYNPRKPHKWGYKMYVLSGVSGFAYDIEFYTGEPHIIEPAETDIGASSNIVMRLSRTITPGVCHRIYFDNYFTSLNLLVQLEHRQIQSLGTIRLNRLRDLGGPSEADMKKDGRGSYSEYVTTVEGVQVSCVRWYDNKLVSLVSTFVGAEPCQTIQRYSKKEKARKNIVCPKIISVYNKHMGGVDTLDSLMGLYRIRVRSKKYYQRIFYHCIDLAVVNSWLLYRRALKQKNSDEEHLALAEFKANIAEGLCKVHKSGKRSAGRPLTINCQKKQRQRIQVRSHRFPSSF